MRTICFFVLLTVLSPNSRASDLAAAPTIEGKSAQVSPIERRFVIDPGVPIDVTPGQRFYSELWVRKQKAYMIERPFESRMPGSMRIPFSFALDDTLLVRVNTSQLDGWEYYAPPNYKFRAWHGLIGDVLANGDTVGLRVGRNGRMEWFVDNSIHNNMTTIWSRPVRKTDPAVTETLSSLGEPFGAPIRHLDYLGVRSGAAVVRYTEISPNAPQRVDEYAFPVDDSGVATGYIMGAKFAIRPDATQRAQVVVIEPMDGDYGRALTDHS